MTDLMNRPDIVEGPVDPNDDVQHITCCTNPDIALCATDVSGHSWQFKPTSCIVCADLEKQPEIICPFTKLPCNGLGLDDE